jgi:serine/threonine-protein kinase
LTVQHGFPDRLKHYELLGHLGSGGMGEVYRARDTLLGRELAIKILPERLAADRDRRERFEKEARLASTLNHPNIVTIYEIGWDADSPYIAMELVNGKTLRESMGLEQRLPFQAVIEIATQLADALSLAHETGIVHRDLKPENVMITRGDRRIKILDFGLGKDTAMPKEAADGSTALAPLTSAGTIMGTVEYMSPEQATGKDVDFHSDQFSLGTMLFEMVTGMKPFHRASAVQTMSAIIEQQPPMDRVDATVPQAFHAILQRCLEKDPQKRFRTTRELFAALRQFNLSSTIIGRGAPAIAAPHAVPRFPLRTLAAVMAGLLVVIGGVIGGRSLSRRWTSPPANRTGIPDKKSVVILPFRFSGDDVGRQLFANGLSESVALKLMQLTMLPSLQIAPPSEVRTREVRTLEDARDLLGANLVVQGTLEVTPGGDSRITCSLTDVHGSKQLSAETVTTSAGDSLDIQDRVVTAIVQMLGLQLQPSDGALLESRETRNPAAKDLYLRARGYVDQYDKPENVDKALVLLQQSLDVDPRYALAEAAIGDAYMKKFDASKDSKWVSEAQTACEAALKMNEKLPAAHNCLGAVYRTTGRYEDAIPEFQRAIQIEPTNDDFYADLGRVQDLAGKPEEAEKTFKQSIELRPYVWLNYNRLAIFYSTHGRNQDAVEPLKKVIQLAPDGLYGYNNLAGIYNFLGRYDDAISMYEHAVAIRPTAVRLSNLATVYFNRRRFLDSAQTFEKALQLDNKNYTILGNLGDAYYWAPGKRGQAPDAYRKAIALGKGLLTVNPRDGAVLGKLAGYYAMLADKTSAMENLQRALAIKPSDPEVRFKAALINNQFHDTEATLDWLDKAVQAGYSVTTIRDLPNFDGLWSNPRFQQLLRGK